MEINPASLTTNGIYSNNDLDCLRNHIMFPVEKPSVLNIIDRQAMGQHIQKKYRHAKLLG